MLIIWNYTIPHFRLSASKEDLRSNDQSADASFYIFFAPMLNCIFQFRHRSVKKIWVSKWGRVSGVDLNEWNFLNHRSSRQARRSPLALGHPIGASSSPVVRRFFAAVGQSDFVAPYLQTAGIAAVKQSLTVQISSWLEKEAEVYNPRSGVLSVIFSPPDDTPRFVRPDNAPDCPRPSTNAADG